MKNYFLSLLLVLTSLISAAQTPESTLNKLGITLPPMNSPIANYVKYVQVGKLIYLSGHGPEVNGVYQTGKLGKDISIEQGYAAAKQTGISLIATLKTAVGDLTKVKRIVKVLGMVNCSEDFKDQPKVINGFSDLMVQVFGDKGKHARSAVGMNALPMNMIVEIEMIVEVE